MEYGATASPPNGRVRADTGGAVQADASEGEGMTAVKGGRLVELLASHAPSRYNYWYPYVSLLSLASLFLAICVHVFSHFVPLLFSRWRMLERYPDMLTMLFVEFSFVHFVGFFVFLYWLQLTNVRRQQTHIAHAHVE